MNDDLVNKIIEQREREKEFLINTLREMNNNIERCENFEELKTTLCNTLDYILYSLNHVL